MRTLAEALVVLMPISANSDEWLNVDTYIAVLDDRYPGYEVVGPIFGPAIGRDLRSSRLSPQNFVNDILVADFNHDDIEGFAAVQIQSGSTSDP